MAGDPDLAATEAFAFACERGGADLLELGIPFSDPIADGPEIQKAGQRALEAGTKPREVVDLAARIRKASDLPIVLMTYMNPIEAFGPSAFPVKAAQAGVDGVIIPDVSFEESDAIRESFDGHGVDFIQLVAPSTPVDRARRIGRASRGFLYVVARYGTTGTRDTLPADLASRLADLRTATSLPLAVGFGVTSREHVLALSRMGADGIVVGSAVVRMIEGGSTPEAIERFVAGLAPPRVAR